MIHDFVLNSTNLASFTAQEIQTICLNISDKILAYFQDVLFKDKQIEQLQMATYRSFIRRYVGSLEGMFDFSKTPPFILKVIDIQLHCESVNNSLLTLPMKLTANSFKSVGHFALIKLLKIVFDSTLSCLNDLVTTFSPHNALMVEQCQEKSKLIQKLLTKVVLREFHSDNLLIEQNTVIDSITLKIDILY